MEVEESDLQKSSFFPKINGALKDVPCTPFLAPTLAHPPAPQFRIILADLQLYM